MGSRQMTRNIFTLLIKLINLCLHQAPFIICSFYTLYIYIPALVADVLLDVSRRRGRSCNACLSLFVLILDIGGLQNENCKSGFWFLSPDVQLIVGLPSRKRRTTSYSPPSDVPGAGCQRDEKEERTAYPSLCHILKANIQQDRLHEFASHFSHPTLPPAAVQ